MRQETNNIYKFSELEEKAQKTAMDRYREYGLNDDWYDFIFYDFIKKAAKKGFNTTSDNIQFSGFYSQGDGASFTGSVNIEKYLISENNPYPFLLWAIHQEFIDQYINIYRKSSFYSHEFTCAVSDEYDINYCGIKNDKTFDRWANLFLDALTSDLKNTYLDLCRELNSMLEKEYDYQTSDEYIKEIFELNDYEFYISGKIA